MSDYIPDPIELGEMRADAMALELELPDGHFKCCQCKEAFPLDQMVAMTPDPYSPPICSTCADNYDGAPHCQYCGARTAKACDCGPIADNH